MFRKLLIPLDRSAFAEKAVGAAAAIAGKSNAGLDIVMVHVPVPYAGFADIPWYDEQWREDLKYVETVARELEAGAGIFTTFAVPKGNAVDEICNRAIDVDADLIVMTSHGRTGLSRMWLGSTADGVMRRASVPVLMLRPTETKTSRDAVHKLFKHLLITLDGSSLSEEILDPAVAVAKCADMRITLLRVVQPIPMIPEPGIPFAYTAPVPDQALTASLANEARHKLDSLAERLIAQGLKVDTAVLVRPWVGQAIVEFAADYGVDLLALSSHGRGASRLLIGSVADKVIRGSGLPVLIQRPLGVPHVGLAAPEPMAAARSL